MLKRGDKILETTTTFCERISRTNYELNKKENCFGFRQNIIRKQIKVWPKNRTPSIP